MSLMLPAPLRPNLYATDAAVERIKIMSQNRMELISRVCVCVTAKGTYILPN